MIPLRDRDVEAAWNADVPGKYRIDRELVRQNLLTHPLLHETASGWDGEGFVAVKRSAAGLYSGPEEKVAHLALFNAASSAALAQSVDTLRAEGYRALVVGQDSGHFLPGAPTDVPWMGRFLRGQGFSAGDLSFDVERDLVDHQDFPTPARAIFRPLGAGDRSALNAFLSETFPGRWRYDVLQKFEVEGPETVFGLFVDDACQGFALIQTDGCRMPIAGAGWRNDLGPKWGALGPIGISERIRKEGLGAELLNRALAELRRRGARRTIIDWTNLLDFYGAEGFAVTRAYRSYRLDL